MSPYTAGKYYESLPLFAPYHFIVLKCNKSHKFDVLRTKAIRSDLKILAFIIFIELASFRQRDC